ncbi:transposase [Bacillus sp. FJAT-27986]|uniref:transposase n=1 Tax=Bacillus sp. FJAT-27986 TaxID=1743146 RepID=UPI00080AD6E2|nr:transposase [Bacillus sp. FJAT-27986]OCA83659.1 transposase [Bacillus sp. FJAT-27986]
MNEDFIKALYKSIVIENLKIYNELFNTITVNKNTDEYWVEALDLYSSLSEENKKTLMKIIKQTMIDTISNVLGVIDGNSTLDNFSKELTLYIEEMENNDDLQDLFLEFIEDINE